MRMTILAIGMAALFAAAGLATAAEGIALGATPAGDIVCFSIQRYLPPLPVSCFGLFFQCLRLGLPFQFCIVLL